MTSHDDESFRFEQFGWLGASEALRAEFALRRAIDDEVARQGPRMPASTVPP